MAKYKVGDKVRIVSEMPCDSDFDLDMRRFLGKEITISMAKEWDGIPRYYSEDAKPMNFVAKSLFDILGVPGYYFRENWISGLAEPEKPTDDGLSVVIRFHGNWTVAELYKNGKVVRVENARCNPKDKYSRAEGARIAVERLFAKKEKEPKKTNREPRPGDKFVIIGNSPFGLCHHFFDIGEVVTFVSRTGCGPNRSRYINARGVRQSVMDDCVKPYEGK